MLLAEASVGDWTLAWVRAGDTILGGGLALLGARLLWPSPERTRLPVQAAAAMRAMRSYLGHAVARFDDRTPEAGEILRSARRAVGLATMNAEESLQRALAEAHGDERMLAPALTILAYIRRITASVAALSLAKFPVLDDALSESPLVRARVERLGRQIATLHDAVDRLSRPNRDMASRDMASHRP